ncbi:MAG: hypothetical protein M3Z26_00085 [Bacteroidota bacterium]|nr:hypothetical protein [Bacteroidota bacterium]
MNKFFDLRFVIGLFFLVVGILLLIYSFTNLQEAHQSVNRYCSLAFIVFAVVMIVLAFGKNPEDKL